MVSPSKIADNIWFHGLHVPKLGWLRTGYQGCVRAVRRKLQEIQPDIVHGQGTERDCAISAVLSGFPNVLTIHGCMNAIAKLHQARVGTFYWLASHVENFTVPRTHGVICISEYVENLVKKYQVPTWIVPNPIQKMFFEFPREEKSSNNRPLIINVGVISERKRQTQLLAVLESLRKKNLQFDTIFVGRSEGDDLYQKQFGERLAAADQRHGGFKHIKRLDDAAFCKLMDEAAAMIHFSSEESFGLTFAEAIARGLYLFASDVGAARFICRDIDNAQVFPVDGWNEMQAAVEKWLVEKAYLNPRPNNPPQEFAKKFHPIYVAERHVEIYRAVLEKPY